MIILDVIYIGLPFFFWQEDESEHGLDVHVTEGFQKLGFHVYPLNAGDDAEEICSAYNWHTSFVDENEDITPSEEFISEHVLWDDFRLLYISAAAATSEDEYTQFVCHTAEFAKESGLVVAAEVVDGDSDDEDPYPWRDKATVLWSRGDILPSGGPACAVRLALGRGITIASQGEERTYDVQVVSECFIPSFLQGLLEGRDPFSIIESYVS